LDYLGLLDVDHEDDGCGKRNLERLFDDAANSFSGGAIAHWDG
jgi:hypothetical protein